MTPLRKSFSLILKFILSVVTATSQPDLGVMKHLWHEEGERSSTKNGTCGVTGGLFSTPDSAVDRTHFRSQFLVDPLPSHRPGDARVITDMLTDCQVRGQEGSVHKIYHDCLGKKLALPLSAHLGLLLLLKVLS